jgi:DNA-binding response OmpR family regulator
MKTILIIEDDKKIALALKVRLQKAGYAVNTASNGVDGLTMAKTGESDLVILDMMMPIGSGASVAYRLRESAPHLPFICFSASKQESTRHSAESLGAVAFFEKPYDFQQLLSSIEGALNPEKLRTEQTIDLPTPSPAPKPPEKILIVEDDHKIALALSARLTSSGYETTVASDALSGVATAVKLQPDLVLLDISMPAGNGFSVAERIKALIAKPIPFIFLTASKMPGLREKADALGAAGFFEKPYDSATLLAAIRRVLPGRTWNV